MFDLAPYNSNPLARILDTRQQRALSREIAEVTRPAQRKQAHITSTAKVSMTAMQAVAGLSAMEAQLSTDEVVARRLGRIMGATTSVIEADVWALGFEA